jgi:hypothetical protein
VRKRRERELEAKHKKHKKKIIILCSSFGTIVVGGSVAVGVVLTLPKPRQTPPEPELEQLENYLIYDDAGTDTKCTIYVDGNFLINRESNEDGATFDFTDTEGNAHFLNRTTIKEFYLEYLPQIKIAPRNYLLNMCCGFTNLTKADIRIPNTITNVNSYFCASMFKCCESLSVLPSNFNLPTSITTVGSEFCAYMFYDYKSLATLPTNFNLPTSIVTVGVCFCERMFAYCTNLTSNTPSIPFNIPTVTGAFFCEYMFSSSGINWKETPQPGDSILVRRGKPITSYFL